MMIQEVAAHTGGLRRDLKRERDLTMAVSDKARAWFQKNHGYSLREGFEMIQSGHYQEVADTGLNLIPRGVPDLGSTISADEAQRENDRLVEILALRTGKVKE